ncbi:5-hydroxytryptamine receptor 2 [Biomphalaria glabrata]|nr:5-hydroxytryptamine receptor 2 [Biomphalaria glabrata]
MSDLFQDLSQDQLDMVMILSNKVLLPLFQGVGTMVNILNTVIFVQLGFKDVMNISFLAVSLSDLGYTLCNAAINVCLVVALSPWQQNLPVSMLSLGGWLICYQYIFVDTSTCAHAYLALARCCCVTMPFTFKNVFTARRTVFIIVDAFIINTVFRIPLVTSHGLSWQTSLLTNATRLTIWFSNDYPFFMYLEKIICRTVLPVIFLLVTFLCTIILTYALVVASRKRSSMIIAKNFSDTNVKKFKAKKYEKMTCSQNEQVKRADNVLSCKELLLIKAVTLITALKAITLLFVCVFALAEALVPEFFPGRKYNRLHATVTALISIVMSANQCGNFFVYCAFNKRYRYKLKHNFFQNA